MNTNELVGWLEEEKWDSRGEYSEDVQRILKQRDAVIDEIIKRLKELDGIKGMTEAVTLGLKTRE